MAARIYQNRLTLIIIYEVGVFLEGIEGEGFNFKHWESLSDRSKVMNYAFNLGYGN